MLTIASLYHQYCLQLGRQTVIWNKCVFFLSMQCDIENPQVDQSVLDEFCKKHNIAGWYELCM